MDYQSLKFVIYITNELMTGHLEYLVPEQRVAKDYEASKDVAKI